MNIYKVTLLFLMLSGCISGIDSNIAGSQEQVDEKTPGMSLTPAEYLNFIRSNESGLIALSTAGNIQITASYLPVDYCALMETGPKPSKSLFDSLRTAYAGATYFMLDFIELDKDRGDTAFTFVQLKGNEMLATYFGYEVSRDIKLLQLNDTLNCSMSHYIDNGSISKRMSVICAFPEVGSEEVTLIWNDGIVAQRTHEFYFNADAIQLVNSINLKL